MKKRNILALTMAVCIAVLGLAGCGSEKKGDSVKLTWYVVGSEQRDLKLVNEEINKITREKIGAEVDIKMLDWSAYDQKMNMIIATRDEFDLCWTAPQTNDYFNNVARGAFVELDEMLKTKAPNTWKSVDSEIWNAARVNGKLYGVINNQIMSTSFGFGIQRPISDASGIYYGDINSYKDLAPMLEFIKKNYPDKICLGYTPSSEPFSNALMMFGFEAVGANRIPGVIRLGDDSEYKIFNQYETDEFKEFINIMHDWYQKGYLKSDAATTNEYEADMNAGKIAIMFPSFLTEDTTISDLEPDVPYGNTGVPYYSKRFFEPWISTDRATATMTAISATSKHPEKAMELIELINTDKELYNLLCFGIEGKHYEKVKPYKNVQGAMVDIKQIENSGYAPNTSWMFGNTENVYIKEHDVPVEHWKQLNEEAHKSTILGFTFDSKNVRNEISMCNNVLDEYLTSLTSGSADPNGRYEAFIEKLKTAGCDKIVAEKQRQMDEWVKNNK